MKFGKEFGSQMVPEWQEAYMNYNYLKTLLKEILLFRQRPSVSNKVKSTSKTSSLRRKGSLFRAFSGLTSHTSKNDKQDEVIMVSTMQQADEEQGEEYPRYQTIFLKSLEEGGELELIFFRRLDNEFNKVVNFYRTKVKEVVKEAKELDIQMEALIALRIKVHHRTDADVTPLTNETNTGSNPLEVIQESKITEVHQEIRWKDANESRMASLEVLNCNTREF